MKTLLASVCLFLLSAPAFAADVPQGIACVEPNGAKERVGTIEGTKFLPDVVLTRDTKIVRWTDTKTGQVYGFLQIGDCAVPKVFYLGPHTPVSNV